MKQTLKQAYNAYCTALDKAYEYLLGEGYPPLQAAWRANKDPCVVAAAQHFFTIDASAKNITQ